MAILGSFAGRAQATPESGFWTWFQRNESELFDFELDREGIFDRLAMEMHKVNPDITFEFGPKSNGAREFVISADGMRAAFPSVESLYAAAPHLARWNFTKFRPRRPPFDLGYNGVSVKAASVTAIVVRDDERGGVTLFVPGYSEAEKKTFTGIAFLLLDHALGKYDVETRVGFIRVQDSSTVTSEAVPLQEFQLPSTAFSRNPDFAGCNCERHHEANLLVTAVHANL